MIINVSYVLERVTTFPEHDMAFLKNPEKQSNGELTTFVHQGASDHCVHTACTQQTNGPTNQLIWG